ncbi:MAG: hypothetical protein RIF32_21595, partial [Leptospirales bacterium]
MSTTTTAANDPAGPGLSRGEFLQKFPWDPAWERYGSPVEDLWVFEYDYSLEQLWPVIADTSTLNNRLDLPP